MEVDTRQLQKALNDMASKLNALMAITSGLATHIYETQGEESLEKAKAKAKKVADEIGRSPSVGVDSRWINSVFDNVKP